MDRFIGSGREKGRHRIIVRLVVAAFLMTAGNERNRLFVVHGHAGGRLADILSPPRPSPAAGAPYPPGTP